MFTVYFQKFVCRENLALNTLILVSSENEHSFPIAALESFPTCKKKENVYRINTTLFI